MPIEEHEPALKDVKTDLRVGTFVAKDASTLGFGTLTFHYAYVDFDGDEFSWMPDVEIVHRMVPIVSSSINITDGTDDITLDDSGLITFDTDDKPAITEVVLYGAYAVISNVSSVREAYVRVNQEIAILIQQATQATVGAKVGIVELAKSDGTLIRTKKIPFIPGAKVGFNYEDLKAAGNSCTIHVYLESKLCAGTIDDLQLNGLNTTVAFGLDLKNKVEDMFFQALITGGAMLGTEVLIPQITKMIEGYIGGNSVISSMFNTLKAFGISVTDLGIALAAGYGIRYLNKADFSLEDFLSMDNLMGILRAVITILLQQGMNIGAGVLVSMLGSRMSSAMVGKLMQIAGRAASTWFFVTALLAYTNTIKKYSWV
jgi:preprotein translocase subunit SecG